MFKRKPTLLFIYGSAGELTCLICLFPVNLCLLPFEEKSREKNYNHANWKETLKQIHLVTLINFGVLRHKKNNEKNEEISKYDISYSKMC